MYRGCSIAQDIVTFICRTWASEGVSGLGWTAALVLAPEDNECGRTCREEALLKLSSHLPAEHGGVRDHWRKKDGATGGQRRKQGMKEERRDPSEAVAGRGVGNAMRLSEFCENQMDQGHPMQASPTCMFPIQFC